MPKTKDITSPLKLINVQVLRSSLVFNSPKAQKEKINKIDLFSNYTLDVDFSIDKPKNDIVVIFFKIGVNQNNNKPDIGYSLFAEMLNVFDVKKLKKNFKEKELKKIVVYSGLGIAINNIRNHLSQLTHQAPFGEYLLPALDVQSVIDSKLPKENNNPSPKSSKKK